MSSPSKTVEPFAEGVGPTGAEILSLLRRGREGVTSLLAEHPALSQRAALLPALLRSLWPAASLAVCLLGEEQNVHVGLVDGMGAPRPEWEAILTGALTARWKGEASGEGVAMPAALGLGDQLLVVQEIGLPDQPRGIFALGISKETPSEALAAAHVLLSMLADVLTARLLCEFDGGPRAVVLEEQAEYKQRAHAGELTGPVVHEFNNFLNVVLMHFAVLEIELPENLKGELVELRRQAYEVADVIKLLQQDRRQKPAHRSVDVNRLLTEVVNQFGLPCTAPNAGRAIAQTVADGDDADRPPQVPIDVALADHLPGWIGSAVDLNTICTFLLRNAVAAACLDHGRVVVRTESVGGNIVMRVEDSGAAVGPESLLRFFEPTTPPRSGTKPLELAACRNLVRRYQGKIHAENLAEGGIAVVVKLPGERK